MRQALRGRRELAISADADLAIEDVPSVRQSVGIDATSIGKRGRRAFRRNAVLQRARDRPSGLEREICAVEPYPEGIDGGDRRRHKIRAEGTEDRLVRWRRAHIDVAVADVVTFEEIAPIRIRDRLVNESPAIVS